MKSSAPLAGVLVGLLPLLSGCPLEPHACNLMYAPDSLLISLESDGSFFQSGDWLLEVDGVQCLVTLPADDTMVFCDPGDGTGVEIGLADDRSEVVSVMLMGRAPAALEMALSFDDAVVFSQELSPSYSVDEPNGEGCGERSSSEIVVELTAE